MSFYLTTLHELQKRFPDDVACVDYLIDQRWPEREGFRCPRCGHDKVWEYARPDRLFECKSCRDQTSVKAGTIPTRLQAAAHHLVPRAAWLMATHSNGISAKQLQRQLGLDSYKSA